MKTTKASAAVPDDERSAYLTREGREKFRAMFGMACVELFEVLSESEMLSFIKRGYEVDCALSGSLAIAEGPEMKLLTGRVAAPRAMA